MRGKVKLLLGAALVAGMASLAATARAGCTPDTSAAIPLSVLYRKCGWSCARNAASCADLRSVSSCEARSVRRCRSRASPIPHAAISTAL
jgi:hypothetical protein